MSVPSHFPRGGAAIVGAATFGVGRKPSFQASDLAARASIEALREAGLRPSDVDGLFFCHSTDTFGGLSFAQYLGIQPKVIENSRSGGSAFQTYVELACVLLAAGYIETALVAYGSNQATASGKLATTVQPMPYEAPYRPIQPITPYALAASRHMHLYGTSKEQLGEVAIAARSWAILNPEAERREPLTMESYLTSRLVSDPLSVLDCCLVSDSGGAVVLTRSDRARDLVATPVYILGAASETSHRDIAWMPELTETALVRAGQRSFACAGLRPEEIDVVELYDAFTINTILFLEDLGFCRKGEGGSFVEGGRIAVGGSLPVNTNGGGLSCAHPGMYGLFTIIEAVRQLRGEAGDRQVINARTAIAQGNGGVLSAQSIVLLGRAEVL